MGKHPPAAIDDHRVAVLTEGRAARGLDQVVGRDAGQGKSPAIERPHQPDHRPVGVIVHAIGKDDLAQAQGRRVERRAQMFDQRNVKPADAFAPVEREPEIDVVAGIDHAQIENMHVRKQDAHAARHVAPFRLPARHVERAFEIGGVARERDGDVAHEHALVVRRRRQFVAVRAAVGP